MIIFLVRVWPDGLFDDPPEKIIQAGNVGEGAERIPDRNFRVTIKETKKKRDGGTEGKGNGTIAEGEDTTEKEQSWNELDGDGETEGGRGSEGEPPFPARIGFGFDANQEEDAGDHRPEHKAVEVGGPGETPHRRIPR